ncbi:microtubule organization protein AKNA-like isoform X1 [Sarcophilus harrisii]|uniref:microtubule organization protein AKNA-like isoform X1 n=1 Tax=Sarcophilus harrisii TaxID=9305 RepID=UPI001301F674|nr:microtubule organization protein AKNA-like isoform X1 [Sarcophilus harrisii]
MAFKHLARNKGRIAKNSTPGKSPCCSKSVELFCGDQREPIKTTAERQTRSSSVLQQTSRASPSSKWESTQSRFQVGRNKAVEQRPHSSLDGIRGRTKGKQSDGIPWNCFRDRVPSRDPGSPFSLETSMKNNGHKCRHPKDKEATVKERAIRKMTFPRSDSAWISDHPKEQQKQKQLSLPQPGGWYLTPVPPDPATPNLNIVYGPFVPLLPFSYPGWFYLSTASPCSASAGSLVQGSSKESRQCQEERDRFSPQGPGHQGRLKLNINDLDDVYGSLCEAVKAARDIQLMTEELSRSLSSDLNRARTLRDFLSTLRLQKR